MNKVVDLGKHRRGHNYDFIGAFDQAPASLVRGIAPVNQRE